MLLPKQVVQVEKIRQWAVITWTLSRGSFYVNIRVKLARYVCNSESKWKILDEVENTICTCIKAYFRPETSTWKVLASIGVRAGGAGGAAAPPKILGSKRNLGKASF